MKDPIDIDEVCLIANVAKTTVYRRIKKGTFPKPKKITVDNKPVNRWERSTVMRWLLKGNDPKWVKQPVKHIKAACAKLSRAPVTSKQLTPALQPRLGALFCEQQLPKKEVERLQEAPQDLYDFEPVQEPSPTSRYVAQAVIGALLAGIAVMMLQ